jgi:MFS family permease
MSCSSQSVSSDVATIGTPPVRRFYYGWVMLPIATLAMICTSPAQTFGISTFNEPLRQALGLSHSQLTGAYMLGTFLASLPLSLVGAWMDRFGLRRTTTVVVLLLGAACIATARVNGLITLFFAFLMLRMLGQGSLGLLSGNMLPFWFRRRLGTVEGIRHFGMAGAIAVVPAINLALINAFGWRTSWVILGLTVWAIMLPLMLVFRNRPVEVGQHVDGASVDTDDQIFNENEAANSFTFNQVRRTRAFWIVGAMTAFWAMANTAVVFNIVPLFLSRGLGEQHAALFFTGFAVSLAFMQLVGGVLADHFVLNRLLSIAAVGMALSMGMVWQIDSPMMVLPLSIMIGLSQGLLNAAGGPLWPRYYGTAHIGRIRGVLATAMVSASSVGPFILGFCVDWLGSYGPGLILFTLMPVPLILLALFATPPRSDNGQPIIPHETPPEASA